MHKVIVLTLSVQGNEEHKDRRAFLTVEPMMIGEGTEVSFISNDDSDGYHVRVVDSVAAFQQAIFELYTKASKYVTMYHRTYSMEQIFNFLKAFSYFPTLYRNYELLNELIAACPLEFLPSFRSTFFRETYSYSPFVSNALIEPNISLTLMSHHTFLTEITKMLASIKLLHLIKDLSKDSSYSLQIARLDDRGKAISKAIRDQRELIKKEEEHLAQLFVQSAKVQANSHTLLERQRKLEGVGK